MMRITTLILILLSKSAFAFPMQELYEKLDIASFDSSLMPMMESANEYRTFKDLNQSATSITQDKIVIDSVDWTYSISVLKKKGQDLYVCFSDKSKVGSYDTQSPLLIRKYKDIYVAIAQQTTVCDEYAR